MKKDIKVALFFCIISLILFARSFSTFFAQDDFVLITEYTKGTIAQDFLNLFSYPSVSHFRPFHNLYFFITGRIFQQNFVGYHFVTFLIFWAASYLVYKVGTKLVSPKVGITAGLIFIVSPIHFASLYWISGSAILMGFTLFLGSFLAFTGGKKMLCVLLYIAALFASEAMLAAIPVFIAYTILFKKQRFDRFLAALTALGVFYGHVRFFLLADTDNYSVYKLHFDPSLIGSLKFYVTRLMGFAETGRDNLLTIIILGFTTLVFILVALDIKKKLWYKFYLFSLIVCVSGFFPFVFLSDHLLASYMTLSFWGLCLGIAIALSKISVKILLLLLFFWTTVQIVNISNIEKNNWIISRSNLARTYLLGIEKNNLGAGSKITFDDSGQSSSQEAYIALGQGKALEFWFPNKGYQACFSFYQRC